MNVSSTTAKKLESEVLFFNKSAIKKIGRAGRVRARVASQ